MCVCVYVSLQGQGSVLVYAQMSLEVREQT